MTQVECDLDPAQPAVQAGQPDLYYALALNDANVALNPFPPYNPITPSNIYADGAATGQGAYTLPNTALVPTNDTLASIVTAGLWLIVWLLCAIKIGGGDVHNAAASPGGGVQGAIIAAVRFAEKEIPDDAKNKSLARLDVALNYVLRVYEQVTGDVAVVQVRNDFSEGIQRIYHKLEREGTL